MPKVGGVQRVPKQISMAKHNLTAPGVMDCVSTDNARAQPALYCLAQLRAAIRGCLSLTLQKRGGSGQLQSAARVPPAGGPD